MRIERITMEGVGVMVGAQTVDTNVARHCNMGTSVGFAHNSNHGNPRRSPNRFAFELW
jgi:hypothetical protein